MIKALILGGGNSEIPLIRECTRRGFYTITLSKDKRQVGHLYSNKAIYNDYSSLDEVLEIAKQLKPDLVIPGANDFSLLTATRVAEILKLTPTDSSEVLDTLIKKDKFKDFARSYDIPVGNYIVVTNSENLENIIPKVKFPCIVKPVDLTGGKGMSRVDSPLHLIEKLKSAQSVSRSDKIVIEDWFEGTLHSYSMLVKDGSIIFEYFDTEFCIDRPFLVSSSISSCRISNFLKESVKHFSEIVIKNLRLSDGVLHCQFMAIGNELRILEYTRRTSGDLYSEVVRYVTGLNHSSIYVDQVYRGNFKLDKTKPIGKYISRHCVSSNTRGTYQTLDIDERIKDSIYSVNAHFIPGAHVNELEKVATCLLVYPTESIMRQTLSHLNRLIKSRIIDENSIQ